MEGRVLRNEHLLQEINSLEVIHHKKEDLRSRVFISKVRYNLEGSYS